MTVLPPTAGGAAIDSPVGDKSGLPPADRPNWRSEFVTWWRRVRGKEPRPLRVDLIVRRFGWLEEEFGFHRHATEDRTMYSLAVWRNDDLDLSVMIDVREGIDVEFSRHARRPDDHRHGLFGVAYFREHGTLAGVKEAARARRLPRDWGLQLDQLAADLRTHGVEILRGDLSLLERLDDEWNRRYPGPLRPW